MTALASRLTVIVYSPADRFYCGLKLFLTCNLLLSPFVVAMEFMKPDSVSYLIIALYFFGAAAVASITQFLIACQIERDVIAACSAINVGVARTYTDLSLSRLVVCGPGKSASWGTQSEPGRKILHVPLNRVEAWYEVLANNNLFIYHGRPPVPCSPRTKRRIRVKLVV